MSIVEKLVTVAENVPKVFNVGRLSVISQSEALKGSASGEVISIRDISPVEHDVKCTLSGEGTDLSQVKVKRLGKNLFNGELKIWENANRIGSKGCVKVKPNTVYTIYTFDYTISPPTFEIRGNHTGKYSMSDKQILGMTNIFNSGEYEYIWFREWKEMTQDGVTLESRVQVEEGRTATEYEPYIEPTEYTANADGTVDGIKSLYPSMTLTSDTEGVIITAEYIKDIDKAFDERLAEIEKALVNN